jgi:hypothetical protein
MGIGYTEIVMVILFALVASVSFAVKNRFASVLIPLAVCMAIAAVATPADLASCLFIGFLLFLAYQIGRRFGTPRMPVVG